MPFQPDPNCEWLCSPPVHGLIAVLNLDWKSRYKGGTLVYSCLVCGDGREKVAFNCKDHENTYTHLQNLKRYKAPSRYVEETIHLDNQRFNTATSQSAANDGPRSAMVSSDPTQAPTSIAHGAMGRSTTTHFPHVSREVSTSNALLNVLQGRRGI